jgi:hypothetical protein
VWTDDDIITIKSGRAMLDPVNPVQQEYIKSNPFKAQQTGSRKTLNPLFKHGILKLIGIAFNKPFGPINVLVDLNLLKRITAGHFIECMFGLIKQLNQYMLLFPEINSEIIICVYPR